MGEGFDAIENVPVVIEKTWAIDAFTSYEFSEGTVAVKQEGVGVWAEPDYAEPVAGGKTSVQADDGNGHQYASYEVEEDPATLSVADNEGVWETSADSKTDAAWITLPQEGNTRPAFVKMHVANSGGYGDMTRVDFFFLDHESGNYYQTRTDLSTVNFDTKGAYCYIPVMLPAEVDFAQLELLEKIDNSKGNKDHVIYYDDVVDKSELLNGVMVRGNGASYFDQKAYPKEKVKNFTFDEVEFVTEAGEGTKPTATSMRVQLRTPQKLTTTATIEMLVDYVMPESDTLSDNTYHVAANENITIDGDKANHSAGKGSLVYVNGSGVEDNVPVLTIGSGATLQNAKSTKDGGEISNNTADGKGGGIYADSKASISFTGAPVVYDNTVGGKQRNVEYSLNDDTNTTINAGTLAADAKIGIYAPSNHREAGQPFGTFTSSDILNRFINDVRAGISDENATPAGYFDGFVHGIDGENDLIYWPQFIARVTADDPKADDASWSYHTWLNHDGSGNNGFRGGSWWIYVPELQCKRRRSGNSLGCQHRNSDYRQWEQEHYV